MTHRTSEQAFAAAASGMVHARPVGDILSRLVKDCVEVTGAGAVAILVLDEHERLGLLASSLAAATHLELLQAQDTQGPCVDVISSGRHQSATGSDEMVRRWSSVGAAISEAGFTAVDAYPMSWRGRVLGGLNVFQDGPRPDDDGTGLVCQAFADVATIVLLHSTDIPADEMTDRVHRATAARDLVEQAKGVLSELHSLDIEQAALRLEELAASQQITTADAAQSVVDQARTRRG
ncbi:MAG: hypothetical protein JWN68_919 [Nocardioides sp.]|jgi:hypothetical protein|uniref:GAF and ANTAR domain-containing protein n=1 Tax=Nocardioides sp. TaxID=35761 RepID=UPI002634E89D|nr:GAF and ANTAR domain-containing protein [Nocardioides sp.]MCW2832966.1 hypothetical protein [Nocardioides sp.]